MSSDRARRSYDASRMYRSVVSQQGRVTVEADANEAEEIRTAESRAELIDIVGPAGTPDDGFKISVPGNGPLDFAIGKGSLYLGGVRVEIKDDHATYLGQKSAEWIDYPAGAPGPYPTQKKKPFTELVYLAVSEQEVSAVEDPALREIALGGPDTAGRTRLIQRVHRALMTGTDCEAALQSVLNATSPGLTFHQETMRLVSTAQLKVDFALVPGKTDLCEPAAQAGFLGAENQLIRVQVASKDLPADPDTLLWGYDNASTLYRATIIDSLPKNQLSLQGTPVDVFHRPQPAQWVEVLGTAVTLGEDAYVANASGVARKIATYDKDQNLITLEDDLPQAFFDSHPLSTTPRPPVFVRIWENRLPFAGNGTTATDLVTSGGFKTGVVVYTSGAAVPGDYWTIGVRPTTPNVTLPSRNFRQFQLPDGPNRWATPLATIAWSKHQTTASVCDCRQPFGNLVELTRQPCCELKVLPGDCPQTIISDRIRWNAAHGIPGLHVRFAAGVFNLDTPLVIGALKGGELTVSGCGTTLVAAKHEVALVLQDWDNANVFDLSVDATVAKPGHGTKLRKDTVPGIWDDEFHHLGGAITIINCQSTTVERVVATCGSGYRRAASCVTIRNFDGQPGTARVRSCAFWAGTRQIGVLLVNVNRATVEDNQIGLRPGAIGRIPDDALKRMLISRVQLLNTEKDQHPPAAPEGQVAGTVQLPGQRYTYYVTADETLAQAWKDLLARLFATPRFKLSFSKAKTDGNRLIRVQWALASILSRIVRQNRTGKVTSAGIEPFVKWLQQAAALTLAAAGHGIVVGGAHAEDIRVLNNTIGNAMDGIHIGLSMRNAEKNQKNPPLFVDRVQVAGNTIALLVPWYEQRGHAGIFLGNVNIATVRDNRVRVQLLRQKVQPVDSGLGPIGPRPAVIVPPPSLGGLSSIWDKQKDGFTVTRLGDGIRVIGVPGDRSAPIPGHMLLIAGNTLQDADIAVHVAYVGPESPDALCRLNQNLAVRAQKAWLTPAAVIVADDNVPAP